MRFSSDNAAEFGRKGGQQTFERYGSQHMATIGRKGFWVTVMEHWGGDARAFINYLIGRGIAATDPFPQNRAFEHNPDKLRVRAQSGSLNYLRPDWQPPEPEDLPF